MEHIVLTQENISDAAQKAAEVLRSGGVVLYPTDTLYGLGADALSNDAVDKIYAIKGRDEGKPMHAIVCDIAMAKRYGELDERAIKLCEKFFPGAFTLIVKKRPSRTTGILRTIDTFGFRIPANEFCIETARAFDAPFTATSANKSGMMPGRNFDEVCAQLGDSITMIDLAIDAGELPESKPSTVVDVSSHIGQVLREGAIPSEQILRYL